MIGSRGEIAAERDHAVIGEQAGFAPVERRDGLARQLRRAEGGVAAAAYVAAARRRDHVVEGRDALAQAGDAGGEGRMGVQYDLDLRGRAGAVRLEVNAYGRVIRELDRNDGVYGDDIGSRLPCALPSPSTKTMSSASSLA